jgi:hypothetical protein
MLFNSPMKYTRILSRQSSYRLQLWRQNSSYLEKSDETSKVLTINDGDSLNNDHGVTQQTSRCCWKFRHRWLRGYNGSVYSVVFTPDGKGLVSGSLDKTLKYWDVSDLVVGRGGSVGGRAGGSTSGGAKGRKEGTNGGVANGPGGSGVGGTVARKEGDKSLSAVGGSQCTMNFTGHKVGGLVFRLLPLLTCLSLGLRFVRSSLA